MTLSELEQMIADLDAAADVVLPTLGFGELVPLADAITAVAKKIADAVAQKGAPAADLAAGVAAADAVADAAEDVKFGKKE
jgi:hypothetical protein